MLLTGGAAAMHSAGGKGRRVGQCLALGTLVAAIQVYLSAGCLRTNSSKHANGLIFIGLSLSRRSPHAHAGSASHQTQFDFDLLQDREYRHVCETNDDGWLVGGGEGAEFGNLSSSWKLPNEDSAHVEVVHIGNGNEEYGGLTEEAIVAKMQEVEFQPLKLRPSNLRLNPDDPPEVELVFHAVDNPEISALQDRLRPIFVNPSVSWPGQFHMSISRKLRFYSAWDRDEFMRRGQSVVEMWREKYPDGIVLQPDPGDVRLGLVTQEEVDKPGGLYLFWGRNRILRYFPPKSSVPSFPPAHSAGANGTRISRLEHVASPEVLTSRIAERHPCRRSKSPKHANGLIFLGLSLSQRSHKAHSDSISRQTQFDFDLLQDRKHEFVCDTNDDGWLVGGGEVGGSKGLSSAWKLANPDSAHVEIAHIGNGDLEHGGLTEAMIVDKMKKVEFKPLKVRPSRLVLNPDDPPELELAFDAVDNPDLAALQKKLERIFVNPGVTWPGVHMSISRKLHFYSEQDRDSFMRRGQYFVDMWRQGYPDGVLLRPDPREVERGLVTQEEIDKPGGLYLFTGRNRAVRYFPPTSLGEQVVPYLPAGAGSDEGYLAPIPDLRQDVVVASLLIYAIAWLLLMWPEHLPLGRPGVALVLAAATCGLRGFAGTPVDVYSKIDPDPIALLFGLMIVNTYLADTGLWKKLAYVVDDEAPVRMLVKTCATSAIMSALFLNDTTCLVLTPCVLKLCAERQARNVLPFLLAISTSSNIGSALTITGNPQNALIASICPSISFVGFMQTMFLSVMSGLVLNIAVLLFCFRDDLVFGDDDTHDKYIPQWEMTRVNSNAGNDWWLQEPLEKQMASVLYMVTVGVTVLGMLSGWLIGLRTHEIAIAAGSLLMLSRALLRRYVRGVARSATSAAETETAFVIRSIDFPLLLMFMGQFVLVGAVVDTGVPQAMFRATLGSCVDNLVGRSECIFCFSVAVLLLSNLISNVPVILMLQPLLAYQKDRQQVWYLCAWVATVAGNLTMLGSAANLIVAEVAIRQEQFEYNATNVAKHSFLPTLVIAAIGAAFILVPVIEVLVFLFCLLVASIAVVYLWSGQTRLAWSSFSIKRPDVERNVELHTGLLAR